MGAQGRPSSAGLASRCGLTLRSSPPLMNARSHLIGGSRNGNGT
jgi:hypothetical protein